MTGRHVGYLVCGLVLVASLALPLLAGQNPIIVPSYGVIGPDGVATGNLDLNGNDLILDADGNSKVDVANDQVEFELGGATPYLTLTPTLSTFGNDVNFGGFNAYGMRYLYRAGQTSDAAALALDISAGDAWAKSAVNLVGANLQLCAGIGRRLVTVTSKATSAGDTLNLVVNGSSTLLTEGVSWACAAAADNAECARNLRDCATMPATVTTSCTDATCSDGKVYLQPSATTVCTFGMSLNDAGGGGAFGTASSSSDGVVYLGSTSTYASTIGVLSSTSISAGSSGYIGWLSRLLQYSTADSKLKWQNNAGTVSIGWSLPANGYVTVTDGAGTGNGAVTYTAQTLTVADSGGAGAAAATLTPTSNSVSIVCNDADGCDITMGEASIQSGHFVYITNTSANVCNFADTATVSELAGAFAMGQYDTITLQYKTDRWVELGRSNN